MNIRSRVNLALDNAGFDGSRSFQTINQALSLLGQTLGRHELKAEFKPSVFKAVSGQVVVSVTDEHSMRIGWYQHPSGTYEVTAYLS